MQYLIFDLKNERVITCICFKKHFSNQYKGVQYEHI